MLIGISKNTVAFIPNSILAKNSGKYNCWHFGKLELLAFRKMYLLAFRSIVITGVSGLLFISENTSANVSGTILTGICKN